MEFENEVLRKVFDLKRDEEAGKWKRSHVEDLRDMYTSANIFQMTTQGEMRCAVPVTSMRKIEMYAGFWREKLRKEAT